MEKMPLSHPTNSIKHRKESGSLENWLQRRALVYKQHRRWEKQQCVVDDIVDLS